MSVFDIKGRNSIFETDVLGSMLPLVCVKNFSLNVVTDLKEITTDGSGLWKDFDYDRLGYTINLNGLTQIFGDDGNPTFYDMYDAMVNFLEVGFRIQFVDNSNNPAIITGQVIVSNKLFDANPVKLLNSSITLVGKGEPVTVKASETNTITFMIEGVVFTADNELTAVDNSYKINDSVIMSTTNAPNQQDLSITFRLIKRGSGSFGGDYTGPVQVGILNLSGSFSDGGTHWEVSYDFDYVPATLNKSFNILLVEI